MTQFLQVRAGHCQLVIDCLYVQEVADWHQSSPPAGKALWNDVMLEGTSLTDMPGMDSSQVTAAVVLRDPQSGSPAILLGVSEIAGLIHLSSDAFRPVLDEGSASSYVRKAAFSHELEKVLLKLEVDVLLQAFQQS